MFFPRLAAAVGRHRRWLSTASELHQCLDGLLVVSIEQAVAAPLCSSKLCDRGARVIKIERDDGTGDFARKYDDYANGDSSYFAWLNRGKQSLAVDLKEEENLKLIRRIISKADVFVQNLSRGATARMGLDSEQLVKEFPGLIALDILGYGNEGPMKDYKAYDLLVCAEAGLLDITGTPEGSGRVGVSIADITTGMNGYTAILEALYLKRSTGNGSHLTVSLFDSVAELMNVPYVQQKYTGVSPKRLGLEHPSIAPYAAFETKSDGKRLLIAIQNEAEWRRLCSGVLAQESLSRDARFASNTLRVQHRQALNTLIADHFRRFTAKELVEKLLEHGIAFSSLNSVADLVQHPQVRIMQITNSQQQPLQLIQPANGLAIGSARTVPELGQHSAQIRREFAS